MSTYEIFLLLWWVKTNHLFAPIIPGRVEMTYCITYQIHNLQPLLFSSTKPFPEIFRINGTFGLNKLQLNLNDTERLIKMNFVFSMY